MPDGVTIETVETEEPNVSMSWQVPIEGEEGFPVLPYNDPITGKSSGWSGSDTSMERAHRRDEDGSTEHVQREILRILGNRGENGATRSEFLAVAWPDVRVQFLSSLTSALSNLHKEGRIARLAERRSREKVYVHPLYVNGRETESQGRNKPVLEHNHKDRFLRNPGDCPACEPFWEARFPS